MTLSLCAGGIRKRYFYEGGLVNLELMQQLYDHNYAMHRRLRDSIKHLATVQFVEGIPYSIGSVRNQMVHVINHDTDHRAQILPALKRMGAPSFEQDFILYLWDN